MTTKVSKLELLPGIKYPTYSYKQAEIYCITLFPLFVIFNVII